MRPVKVVVGLGNPGTEYERTPHNAGFELVRKLAKNLQADKFKKHKDSLVCFINVKGEKVLLALTQLYMNNSGIAVRKLLNEYSLLPQDLIVCYDDLDLPLGTVRLRLSGGAGGHHGMESIISEIGTKSFPRIRLGVGKKGIAKEFTTSYLLSQLDDRSYELFAKGIEKGAEAIKDALFNGFHFAMNRYNKRKEEGSDSF